MQSEAVSLSFSFLFFPSLPVQSLAQQNAAVLQLCRTQAWHIWILPSITAFPASRSQHWPFLSPSYQQFLIMIHTDA